MFLSKGLNRIPIIDPWERNSIRYLLAQRITQRLPAVLHVEENQPILRHDSLQPGDVSVIRQSGERLFLAIELYPRVAQHINVADKVAQRRQREEHEPEEPHSRSIADALHALLPRLGIADRADDFGVGIQLHQLWHESRSWRVSGSGEAVESARHKFENEAFIRVVACRPVRKYFDPRFDLDFGAQRDLGASVVHGPVEEDLQRLAE